MGQDTESLLEIGALAKDYPVHVRFIEMMPIGLGKEWKGKTEKRDKRIAGKQVWQVQGPFREFLGNGPGHYISFEGFQGKIGFISAVSHKFCSSCNRIRLTSQGYLKSCLQYDIGEDLREPLRRGEPEEKIKALIVKAIEKKAGRPYCSVWQTKKIRNRRSCPRLEDKYGNSESGMYQ